MTNRETALLRITSLPLAARVYVAAVIAAGAAAVVAAATVPSGFDQPGLFALLLVMSVVAASAKIELPLGRSQSNLSLSQAITFWALLTLGWTQVIAIAAASACAQCMLRTSGRNPVHRTLFSIASIVVTAAAVSVMLHLSSPPDSAIFGSLVRAAAIAAPLYFFVNTGLVAGAIALSTRQSVIGVWQRNFLWSAPSYLAGAGLAAVAAAGSTRGWFGWLALLAVPLYLVFRSYHLVVARLREEQDETRRAMDVQLATVEALALAIEAKAGCTPEHIRSIQQSAGSLAEACGLSDVDVQAVRTAALLHDVGNMAVPEHILAKPGKLTPEEFERIKIHPRVGAEILRNVTFGAPVGQLVLAHHERWDGLGYPAGLRGDDIPIGARILAIADCFSTLQTDRPYRPARSRADALATLVEHAGTAYDPALVDVFLRLENAAVSEADAPANAPDWAVPEHDGALENIAGAHREEQTLYEIAQALGASLSVRDAMALIDDKLRRLMPFTTCALFLGDDVEGYACQYGHGPGTEALLKWQPRSWSELALRIPSCADGRGAGGEELQAVLACRLSRDERTIGALVIYDTSPGCFTDEHRRVLGRVSEQAAAVMYNSTRFEQTQHESHTDPLTGLSNRRSLDRHFEEGLATAIRTASSASLIVLDLDRLKEINDTYGHEAGDRAIGGVASVLRTTVRQHDLCARFAGDEFIVVLWGCDSERETRRVRELQTAVAAFPFEPRPGVTMSLSISAGSARFPEDGSTFDELLSAADERMYHDKATRRSRSSTRHSADTGRLELA
jgi:diguanylate cyclase (GGDEF)-like protein/putative nucleotidyltransferase with HDIG domain